MTGPQLYHVSLHLSQNATAATFLLLTIFLLTCNTEAKSKNHSLYTIFVRLVSLFLLFTDMCDDLLGNMRILIIVICPSLQVVMQIANSFNFYCSHQSFCHPFCYRRHMRACSRLMKSVRRVRLWAVPAVLVKYSNSLVIYNFLSTIKFPLIILIVYITLHYLYWPCSRQPQHKTVMNVLYGSVKLYALLGLHQHLTSEVYQSVH